MGSYDRHKPRTERKPKPLNPAKLEELGLAYVARFATSAAKLETYLKRKLRERGWEGGGDNDGDGDSGPDIAALAARYVDLGYVDDEAYARSKAGGLLRRGYGPRRVDQALGAAGISEDIRDEVRAGPSEARQAALAMARKRRFGPFGMVEPDRPQREKQLAAMLRAGHSLDSARELVNARDIAAAEEWAGEEED